MSDPVPVNRAAADHARLAQALIWLQRIAALSDSTSGVLLCGDPAGARLRILAERGRICFALVPGSGACLIAALIEASGQRIDPATLRRMFTACQKSGESLTSKLVADGYLSERRLRQVLLRHTCEAILGGAIRGQAATWQLGDQRGYGARYDFTLSEVWYGMVLCCESQLPARAWEPVSQLTPHEGWALACSSDGMPLRWVSSAERARSLQEDMATAAWMRKVLRAASTIEPGVEEVVFGGGGVGDAARSTVVWSQGTISYAVHCPTRSDLAIVLRKRSRVSRVLTVEQSGVFDTVEPTATVRVLRGQ